MSAEASCFLRSCELAVADLGDGLEVAVALGLGGLVLQLLDGFFDVLAVVDELLLVAPAGTEAVALLAGVGDLLLDDPELGGAVFPFDGLALDLELAQAAVALVDLLGYAVELQAEAGGGLVHEVDGLVGQETVADVAVAQLGGGHQGLVEDLDLVVHLVAFLQAAEDGNGVLHAGLLDADGLEAADQRLVLLEVLLVFIQGGGPDGTQVAAGQGGLEDVGRVHRPVAAAGPDEGVDLVDEEDVLSVAARDLLDHALEPLLEVALVLRPGQHAGDVEHEDSFLP